MRNLNTMKLMHFAAFRAVLLTGTVSAAAEILGRSQPAVSRILDRLEYDLGLTLFERRKGAITPTPEAYLLLEEVERMHNALDALRSSAARIADGENRSIHIAVLPALGTTLVPDVVAEYARNHPSTRVSLSVRMSTSIEEWAAAGQVDFGIAELPMRRSGFSSETFSDAPYLSVVPADHPLADRQVVTPEDLSRYPVISWSNFVPMRTLLEQAMNSHGLRLDTTYQTNLSATALAMVRNGMGVGLIDPFTAVKLSDSSVRVKPFLPRIPFHLVMLTPHGRSKSHAVQAFLELLSQRRDAALARVAEIVARV